MVDLSVSPFGPVSAVFGLLAATVALGGCLDEIDLPPLDLSEEPVVIQGGVYAGDAPGVFVSVERVQDFDGSNIPDRVPNAVVTVANSLGEEVQLTYASEDGLYVPPSGGAGLTLAVGVAYSLRVRLPGGREVVSDTSVMLATPDPTALELPRVEVATEVSGVARTVPGFAVELSTGLGRVPEIAGAGLRWRVTETYRFTEAPTVFPYNQRNGRRCYAVDREVDGGTLRLLDPQELSADSVAGRELVRRPTDFKQSEGYVVSVVQQALPPSALRYYREISELLVRDASLFEPPPGIVAGNLRFREGTERVYGLFEVAERKAIRRYVPPDGAQQRFCPRPPSGSPFPAPGACDDCVQFGNATLDKPSYFP